MTVNDVVMTICTGAMRSWLLDQGELPDDPLVAQVAVSVRTEQQSGTWGNRAALMGVQLPTDEPDALRRAQLVHERMRSAKERHKAVPATILQDWNHVVPPALLARASRAQFRIAASGLGVANFSVSNIPGSRQPLYFGGAELLAWHPVSVIMDGVGPNITVISYRDQLDFGITADREQLPDPWPLIDALRDALDELLALVPAAKA